MTSRCRTSAAVHVKPRGIPRDIDQQSQLELRAVVFAAVAQGRVQAGKVITLFSPSKVGTFDGENRYETFWHHRIGNSAVAYKSLRKSPGFPQTLAPPQLIDLQHAARVGQRDVQVQNISGCARETPRNSSGYRLKYWRTRLHQWSMKNRN